MEEDRPSNRDAALGNYIADKLREGEARTTNIENSLAELRAEVKANTAVTAQTTNDVKEVLDLLNMAKSGLRVLGALGGAFRWVGRLAAAGTAIYVAWDLWLKK